MEIKRNDENEKNEIEQEIKKVLQKDENEERRWNIISYVSLVFSDIFLLNIFTFIAFKVNEKMSYFRDDEVLPIIFLWIIDVLVLSLFFYTVKKTKKYLDKL